MMLVVLSLSMMSSFVVASHSVDENSIRSMSVTSTLPLTMLDAAGSTNTSTTTPPDGVQLPAASPAFPATSATTPASLPTTIRNIYVRSRELQHGDGSRPDTDEDRSTYDSEGTERSSSGTIRPRDDDDDDLGRRRFGLMSAAQVNCRLVTPCTMVT